jgi:hypothetical protein
VPESLGGYVREIRESLGSAGNPLPTVSGLNVPVHDYISLSYTSGNLTGAVYKSGGSGGTTVATVAMTYDGSGNLLTVTKT